MGNAVGPVALIAAGIYLGYLTITGRAANFAAFLASGGTTTAPTAAPAGSVASAVQSNLSTAPGSSATGVGAAQTGSIFGALPAGSAGTAAGMSQAQASAAAQQTLDTFTFPLYSY